MDEAKRRSDLSPSAQQALQAIGCRADGLLLSICVLGAIVALCIGFVYGRPGTAAIWGGALLALAAWAYLAVRGSLLSRLALVTAGIGLVALHIQLSLGATRCISASSSSWPLCWPTATGGLWSSRQC
ncbi:hypothetical protein [Paracidovorax cattleyae]|uniref:hypothetical protein n=1 Tax=Paracidovorax cattleyae TaxID=80868 RepID=UPI001E4B12A4|nr:hypothetical protein [Paracidovorax cattleyae]